MGLGGISLADAITRQENAPAYLNNPGALTAAPSSYCQLGKQGILVQFCSYQDGLDALNNQISLNANRGWNLSDFFKSYAPAASGNNPTVYTQNVSDWTGIAPNVPLNVVDPSMLFAGYSNTDATVGNGFDVASLLGGDPFSGSGIDWAMVGLGLVALYVVTQAIL